MGVEIAKLLPQSPPSSTKVIPLHTPVSLGRMELKRHAQTLGMVLGYLGKCFWVPRYLEGRHRAPYHACGKGQLGESQSRGLTHAVQDRCPGFPVLRVEKVPQKTDEGASLN
jgi:hypothetical protein